MSSAYVYRKPVRRTRHAEFRRRIIIIILILAPFIAVGAYIYLGFHNAKQVKPVTSAIENTQISTNKSTFLSDYFQFEDTDTWVLDKNNSTATKLTYHKFRKNVQEAEMVVYINQVPIPLYLATPRVLPVRIVNDNRLTATAVSDACGNSYPKGALHNVKEVNIGFATMLCDPDSPQYYVQLAEVGGNYQLNLKRPSGQPIQFVITYKDTGLDAQPDAILNIANSFKTR
jgi:hypothetical protein